MVTLEGRQVPRETRLIHHLARIVFDRGQLRLLRRRCTETQQNPNAETQSTALEMQCNFPWKNISVSVHTLIICYFVWFIKNRSPVYYIWVINHFASCDRAMKNVTQNNHVSKIWINMEEVTELVLVYLFREWMQRSGLEFSNTEKNKEGLRVHGISTSVLCISKGWNTVFQTTALASLQSLLYELQKQNQTYWSNTHPKKHETASPGISRSPQWALMRNLRLHLHCRTSCTEKLYSARTH